MYFIQQIVSFATTRKMNSEPLSDVELKTLQLRKTEQYLYGQVLQLSDDMER